MPGRVILGRVMPIGWRSHGHAGFRLRAATIVKRAWGLACGTATHILPVSAPHVRRHAAGIPVASEG